ncbi:MAG: single-stranded DNA-binding protein [Deltaproteobacteria bacterium]|nr:single-stranded DNA-binding protein [Deltaproteobacteria bacterium]
MNKAILIGNLGRDPKISNTQNGMTVAKFSIATSEKWRDKNTGEMQKRTEWHRITAFGRLAEICEQYLSTGRQVCIEGRIQTSSWERGGITRYTTEIIASKMMMLGAKDSGRDSSLPKTTEPQTEIPEDSEPLHPEIEEDEIPF